MTACQFDQLNEARAKFDKSVLQQNDLRQKYSAQVLRDRLRIASADSEVDAERIAESFLAGKFVNNSFALETCSHFCR